MIRYQGQIDDNAESPEQVQNHYLRDSIVKVLSNTDISKDYVAPVGPEIQWRPQ